MQDTGSGSPDPVWAVVIKIDRSPQTSALPFFSMQDGRIRKPLQGQEYNFINFGGLQLECSRPLSQVGDDRCDQEIAYNSEDGRQNPKYFRSRRVQTYFLLGFAQGSHGQGSIGGIDRAAGESNLPTMGTKRGRAANKCEICFLVLLKKSEEYCRFAGSRAGSFDDIYYCFRAVNR